MIETCKNARVDGLNQLLIQSAIRLQLHSYNTLDRSAEPESL